MVEYGPASTRVISTTVIPSSGRPVARTASAVFDEDVGAAAMVAVAAAAAAAADKALWWHPPSRLLPAVGHRSTFGCSGSRESTLLVAINQKNF